MLTATTVNIKTTLLSLTANDLHELEQSVHKFAEALTTQRKTNNTDTIRELLIRVDILGDLIAGLSNPV